MIEKTVKLQKLEISSFVETWMESGTGEGFETPNEMLRWIKDLRVQSKQFSV